MIPHPPLQTSPEDGNPPDPSANGSIVRPSLPDRNVTEANIEDAFVRFIFYCNPALPLYPDTQALREAFRNPPRSGGRIFSPYRVYELVKEFYQKDIKTWTELTIKLGVEPPDPAKDESTQKVAQYGVRLKKWMNSMRVKPFFEYLMQIPNDYWTKIPTDPDPIAHPVRDGVAVEDDMALRALLPHIRPKRGRKKPDGEEGAGSPAAQRPRLSPSSAIDDLHQGQSGPWSAHPDSRPPGSLRGPPGWNQPESNLTPVAGWPQSALTPTSKSSFWDDTLEPRSAVTPSKPRLSGQRRGVKNVSSAWRPGSLDPGAKTRGRPPINRSVADEPPVFSHPAWAPSKDGTSEGTSTPGTPPIHQLSAHQPYSQPHTSSPMHPMPPIAAVMDHRGSSDNARPARPSISLQVPERPPGSVRLATPPPPVDMANNVQYPQGRDTREQEQPNGWASITREAAERQASLNSVNTGSSVASVNSDISEFQFEKMEDRTNVDVVIAFFTRAMHDADWYDAEGNPAEAACLEECTALVNSTMETMYKAAPTPQSFLVNLAALSGARMLMTTRAKCTRLGEDEEKSMYKMDWEYRFGKFKGPYTMMQSVPRTMWERSKKEDGENGQQETGLPLTVGDWQKKYQNLLQTVRDKDKELLELRTKVTLSQRTMSASR
ncbi:ARS-binding protein [Paramyrothecium foliicola]|nr:ARS-binding protein [Paramyrothecium foliicola]